MKFDRDDNSEYEWDDDEWIEDDPEADGEQGRLMQNMSRGTAYWDTNIFAQHLETVFMATYESEQVRGSRPSFHTVVAGS